MRNIFPKKITGKNEDSEKSLDDCPAFSEHRLDKNIGLRNVGSTISITFWMGYYDLTLLLASEDYKHRGLRTSDGMASFVVAKIEN